MVTEGTAEQTLESLASTSTVSNALPMVNASVSG